MQQMWDFRLNGDYCDAFLRVRGKKGTVKAHRLVLATASEYLNSRMSKNMINLPQDLDLDSVDRVVEYIYRDSEI
ncbi:hypothetical protein Ciccas_012815 [Cichlidogyrus casuarinus]|uniref:BTB domain-containing protein n=1 Tax=Cichlidogyrus casuarinus TaxID=1844966 RepID=A0ABD2PMZ5_9PLAT